MERRAVQWRLMGFSLQREAFQTSDPSAGWNARRSAEDPPQPTVNPLRDLDAVEHPFYYRTSDGPLLRRLRGPCDAPGALGERSSAPGWRARVQHRRRPREGTRTGRDPGGGRPRHGTLRPPLIPGLRSAGTEAQGRTRHRRPDRPDRV